MSGVESDNREVVDGQQVEKETIGSARELRGKTKQNLDTGKQLPLNPRRVGRMDIKWIDSYYH